MSINPITYLRRSAVIADAVAEIRQHYLKGKTELQTIEYIEKRYDLPYPSLLVSAIIANMR